MPVAPQGSIGLVRRFLSALVTDQGSLPLSLIEDWLRNRGLPARPGDWTTSADTREREQQLLDAFNNPDYAPVFHGIARAS
jgi:hypothetical protein